MHLKYKILNFLMKKGEKQPCRKLLLKSFKLIQKQTTKNSNTLIKLAIINVSPVVQIKHINQKRKKTKEFSFLLQKKDRTSLAIKFVIATSKKNLNTNFYKKFYKELVLCSTNKNSNSIKNKENIQKYAFAIKKYSHYRWF